MQASDTCYCTIQMRMYTDNKLSAQAYISLYVSEQQHASDEVGLSLPHVRLGGGGYKKIVGLIPQYVL